MRALALAAAIGAALAGCTLWPVAPPQLPAPVAVHVSQRGSTAERDFAADSEEARRLKAWVDANHDGWMPLLYTPMMGDALHVDAGSLHLEFYGNTVLLSLPEGGFNTKSVAPSDYAFLRP
ncbi:hypothetical protein [Scleromatobacter humisilvae]|uniref:Lipoprotein n=1 Tax=Scleromatobacter humisilvae TaxID=2897159 RepID=A0A9X1YKW3_9BURK|nr:hypothetical protein [Scleromatobacter humisilvae]MCK9688184.1 hypothetical protein [Scleromatobacter humisilvae]